MRLRSLTLLTCCRSIWALLTTVIEIGTSVTFSTRRCAVTTIASSAGTLASAVCAKAGMAKARLLIFASRPIRTI